MDQFSTATVVRIPRSMSFSFLAIGCLISYALLAGLIVLQNRTIQNQRDVIHVLFKDRQHIGGMSPSGAQSGQLAAQNGGQSSGSSQAQSSSPSSQAKSEVNSNTRRNSRKTRNRAPARPPAESTDPTDLRRVSISI